MPKVYFNDNGMRNIALNRLFDWRSREDQGVLLENYIHRRLTELYDKNFIKFWRTTDKKEIDFIVTTSGHEGFACEVKISCRKVKQSLKSKFTEFYPGHAMEIVSYEVGNECRWVLKKPENLTLEEWQAALRKQYASEQKFKVKNIGDQPLCPDYEVYNPGTKKIYKVSIRDNISSFNYCSCPDFRVNTLGTCKHIEYVLLSKLSFKKYQKLITKSRKNNYSSLSIYYGRDRLVRLKKADHIERYPREEEFFDADGFLLPEMITKLESFIKEATGTDADFRIYPDVFEYIEGHKEARSWQK